MQVRNNALHVLGQVSALYLNLNERFMRFIPTMKMSLAQCVQKARSLSNSELHTNEAATC